MYAESSGQLEEFLQIVRKRKWQILLPATFVFSLSVVVAIIIPRKFHAEGEFEMRHVRVEGDWQFKESSSTSLEIANAEQHLTSHERVRKVLDALQWEDYENLKAAGRGPRAASDVAEYIKRQRTSIGVNVNLREKQRKASAFIEVKYKNVDRERAVEFIGKLVQMWADELIARDEADLGAQRDELQNTRNRYILEFQNALDEKERIEKELGVLPWIGPGQSVLSGKEDPYIQELASVRSDLSRARAELAGKEKRLVDLEDRVALEPESILQDVEAPKSPNAGAVERLEQSIAGLRGQQVGLTPLNSKWQRLQREIETLETELEAAQNAPGETLMRQERVPNEKKREWQDQIDQLRIEVDGLLARIGELDRQSYQLTELQKERTSLKRELDEVNSRITVKQFLWEEAEKTVQEKQETLTALVRANKEPFIWTNPPKAPAEPSEPNPILIIAIGLAGGLALGLGSSMLVEFTKSCYRSVGDVTAVMTLPVLGVVNEIVTRREKRRARLRGLVVLSSSAVMLAVIGWFTWAYTSKPEILPTELLQGVEQIRDNFK